MTRFVTNIFKHYFRAIVMTQYLRYLSLILLAFTHMAYSEEKIIIDADVGVDDTMAVLLAFASPELDVVGIVSSFGNATIENATRNTRHLMDLLGADVPVVQGAAKPLGIPPGPPADFVHGANGLGNVVFEEPETQAQKDISGAEFIVQQSRLYPGELTLVPVGRLTNLALALRLDPTLPQRIKRVVLMGGAFNVEGNVTPVAEANIWGDPHAADEVFSANWQVVAIGLDVTMQVLVNETHHKQLTRKNKAVGEFIEAISDFYLKFYRSIGMKDGYALHDPSAILYLIQPDLFTTIQAPVRVAHTGLALGQTIMAEHPRHSVQGPWSIVPKTIVAIDVNEKKARTLYLKRLADVEFVQ